MGKAFRTAPGSDTTVELANVGYLGAGGKGAVPLAAAAQLMPELQARNDDGSLALDDNGNPRPLGGAALSNAAEKFAAARGLVVADITDEELAAVPAELGLPPDRPPANEVADAEYERVYGGGAVVGNVPAEQVVGDSTVGASKPSTAPAPEVQPQGGSASSGGGEAAAPAGTGSVGGPTVGAGGEGAAAPRGGRR